MTDPDDAGDCADTDLDVARLQVLNEQQRAKIADLEDYSRGLVTQQEHSDTYISSLEERLSSQEKLLTEQRDAGAKRRGEGEEELHQLTEIIEAQESALDDQRRIIETQNSIVDDLQRALGERAIGAGEPQTPRSSTPSRCSDSRASADANSTGGKGRGGGSGGSANSTGQPPSARQRPAPSYPNRSPREPGLTQKLLARSGESAPRSHPGEPPRPRPNSAFEKKPGSQRSRSWTSQAGAGDTGARGPSPGRGPTTGNSRKSSGAHPPHLPALRQET